MSKNFTATATATATAEPIVTVKEKSNAMTSPETERLPLDAELSNISIAVIVSRYNSTITSPLLEAAIQTLTSTGIPTEKIRVIWVPGAWELCLGSKLALDKLKVDAVIALGCVIQGETTHDQHINRAVSASLMQIGLEHSKPIGFGLLTVNTLEQAQARAGGEVGNKGEEAAQAVLDMLRLQKQL